MVMIMLTSLEMGFNQQTNHGIMADHDQHFPYSGDFSSSEESELIEDGSISSGASSPASPLSSVKVDNGTLGDMSSLLQQLPIKRGLSKYFNGKSQSYSSLSNVTCLEDLAKPYNKKLKSCKSYFCISEAQNSPPKTTSSSKLLSKKSSSKRNSNNGMSMPPTYPTPLRSSSTSSFNTCTPLFA